MNLNLHLPTGQYATNRSCLNITKGRGNKRSKLSFTECAMQMHKSAVHLVNFGKTVSNMRHIHGSIPKND